MLCMKCRRPTTITVDGKCVSCFTGVSEMMPIIRPMKLAAEATWSKRGLELMAKYGINPKNVRIIELEEV